MSNVTLDIYRPGNAPPADPDVASVSGSLIAVFQTGCHRGRLVDADQRYTHTLNVAVDVDIRDGYGGVGSGDVAYDAAGTAYQVVFVERRARGTAGDHRRVYLARKRPGT